MRILSLAAAALVAAAMPTEALECRQFGGTCKSKSAGCENGSFRRGFCSGSSVCCVGHEGTRSNFNIKTVGTVNDGHGHTVTIKKFASGNSNRIEPTIFFKAKMAVDADGANSAYNPRDSGIDYLANAGCKNNRGSCYGIGKVNGRLAKQDSNSEYPGFYTSSTSLAWSHSSSAMTKSDNFIDSLKVPYVVVPGGKTFRSRYGARVGDLGVIYDPKTNYVVPVYAADSGPATKIGEASIRLMEAIGHKVYDRNNRCNLGINPSRGIVYVLFSGSGSGRPYTLTDLWKNVEEHIENFGGMAAIAKAVDAPSPVLMTLEQFCAAPTFHPKFNTGRNPNYKVPEGRYCSPTYPSPAEGTMNGGTPVTPAEGSAPTADEAPADSPGSEIIEAAEDALETCDNHGDLFCRPGKSSCAHGYHSGECRGDTWCCKPEPQLAACDNHPDLVCRPGKSSCSNGIHFGECRGDTWCCK